MTGVNQGWSWTPDPPWKKEKKVTNSLIYGQIKCKTSPLGDPPLKIWLHIWLTPITPASPLDKNFQYTSPQHLIPPPFPPKKNTATPMSMTLLTREFGKFSNLKDWRYKSQAQLTKYHSTFILSKNIHVFLNWIARLSEFLISFPRFCCYLIVDHIFCNDHLAT